MSLDGHLDVLALVPDPLDAGDDSGRSATEDLEELALLRGRLELRHGDAALDDGEVFGEAVDTEGRGGVGVLASEGKDGVASDTGEDDVEEGRGDELDGAVVLRESDEGVLWRYSRLEKNERERRKGERKKIWRRGGAFEGRKGEEGKRTIIPTSPTSSSFNQRTCW